MIYCACGQCNRPNPSLRVAIAMVVDAGVFRMPVKYYAWAHGGFSDGEDATIQATLVDERLQALPEPKGNLTEYDEKSPSPFILVPHQLLMYQPSPDLKTQLQREPRFRFNNTPFKCEPGEQQDLVKTWPKGNEEFTLDVHGLPPLCEKYSGIRIEEEKIGFVQGLAGVAMFWWHTRRH